MKQEEFRCSACGKLLFKVDGDGAAGSISIKCPRCRAFNVLRPVQSPNQEHTECSGEELKCGCSSQPPKRS